MSVSQVKVRLAPQTGAALTLLAGQKLEIIDPTGGQVADLAVFTASDVREYFSPGRTIDYNEKIALTTGSALYSNRSQILMRFLEDDVAMHDILLSPCSERMFEILRGFRAHPSCHGNLSNALLPFGIKPDDIESTLNVFMNVGVDARGAVSIKPPISKAGDRLILQAQVDLIVGITACSSEFTNGGTCKPIEYRVVDA
jgi:uncharacterized protein YcgI (DUF1989 family)